MEKSILIFLPYYSLDLLLSAIPVSYTHLRFHFSSWQKILIIFEFDTKINPIKMFQMGISYGTAYFKLFSYRCQRREYYKGCGLTSSNTANIVAAAHAAGRRTWRKAV